MNSIDQPATAHSAKRALTVGMLIYFACAALGAGVLHWRGELAPLIQQADRSTLLWLLVGGPILTGALAWLDSAASRWFKRRQRN